MDFFIRKWYYHFGFFWNNLTKKPVFTKKLFWVLVIGFLNLVSVDAKERSINVNYFQTLEINNEHEFLGLAEVPEIKSEPSDEDSFAVVPKYHGPSPCEYLTCAIITRSLKILQITWSFSSLDLHLTFFCFFMWFARFQTLICELQSIWCNLLALQCTELTLLLNRSAGLIWINSNWRRLM